MKKIFTRALALVLALTMCFALAATVSFAADEQKVLYKYIVGDKVVSEVSNDDTISTVIVYSIGDKPLTIDSVDMVDAAYNYVFSNVAYVGTAFAAKSIAVVKGASVEFDCSAANAIVELGGYKYFTLGRDGKVILTAAADAKLDVTSAEVTVEAINAYITGKYAFGIEGNVELANDFVWNTKTSLVLSENSTVLVPTNKELTIGNDTEEYAATIKGDILCNGRLTINNAVVYLAAANIVDEGIFEIDGKSTLKANNASAIFFGKDANFYSPASVELFYTEAKNGENVEYTATADVAGKDFFFINDAKWSTHDFNAASTTAKYSKEEETDYECKVCGDKYHTTLAKLDITKTFPDVDVNGWYFKDEWIQKAVDAKLFAGTSANTFAPNTTMTREMFVTVLYAMSGDNGKYEVPEEATFEDVNTDKWSYAAVEWASDKAITAGVSTGTSTKMFAPEKAISREEACVMISAYIKAKGTALEGDTVIEFTDGTAISDWASKAVAECVKYGIFSSTSTTEAIFAPQAGFSRAQAAVVFVKLAGLYVA